MENNNKIQKMNSALKYLKDEENKRIETIQAISSSLEGFEVQRKKDLIKMLILEPVFLSLSAVFGCLGLYIFLNNKLDIISAFGVLVCVVVSFFSMVFFFISPAGADKSFKNRLKNFEGVKNIYALLNIQKVDDDKENSWKNFLMSSKLFANFNEIIFDDCFKGSIDGVNYTMTECELINHTNKGKKNESISTVFRGLVVSFDFNKQIGAETIIKSKNDVNFNNTPFPSSKIFSIVLILLFIVGFDISLFGKLVSLFAVSPFNFPTSKLLLVITFPSIIMFALLVMVILITLQNNKKKEVKLEDWVFDKRFNVYSENQVEARYLITPSFMERLKNLETAFGTENLKCSFIKDKVIFAISTKKDLFEFGSLYCPLSESKAVDEVYNQIKSIQNMISYFKLNKKIGF